ncbi:MAG: serine/threonine-protein kinase [Proteobacteria bacterium]|nr:serine/threonine-protein kinase [Pseudomonadota bacterium]
MSRIELFFKVLDAVEYAHSNLIIHRDIKPTNILVEKSGTVKLIDFGVSRLMKTSTDTHQQTIGAALTPSYASPEQLSGKPLSIRSDIYSLGAVLLYLLTGKQVKQTNHKQQQTQTGIKKNLNDSFNSNKKLLLWKRVGQQTLSDIVLVINKAMFIDINLRYQNSQSFQEDLQAIVKIKPIKARKPSKLYWLKKYVARNRITTSIIIMAFLLTLMATALASWHWYKTIQQKDEIFAAHLQLKTYANFLNTTLKGMDAYSGGNPNIKMAEFMQRAVELYKKEQNVSSERVALHAMTIWSIYESWGHYNDALRVLETGYEHAKASSSPHDDVSLLTEKSLLHGNDLQYQLGAQAALEALKIIKQYPETEWRSPYVLLALSSSYRDSGQLAKSLQVIEKIINDQKRTAKEIAFVAYAQAKVQARIFHLDKAIDNINIALKTYKEEYGINSAQVADSEALLFILEIRKTRNSFTIVERNKLMAKFQNTYNENHPNMAWLLATIAEAYYLTGDIKQAIIMQQKALSLYESLSDTIITDITLARMHLARYLIMNNKIDSASDALKVIKNIDLELLPNHVLAEYYILKAWNYILTNQQFLAENSLHSAKEYLKNSEYLGIVAEYNFQVAQLAVLEKQWLKCSQYSLAAIKIATNFYPASWDLHAIYQTLQDKCASLIAVIPMQKNKKQNK